MNGVIFNTFVLLLVDFTNSFFTSTALRHISSIIVYMLIRGATVPICCALSLLFFVVLSVVFVAIPFIVD